MKITNVETLLVSAGPGKRNYTFVVVDTDEGISGVGESGLTSRELAVAGAVEHLKPFLVGKNPFQIEQLWQEMFRGGFFPAGNITSSAIAAIDIALWDIKGKALGVPIYELLGGLVRDKVVCYPHVQRGGSIEALVESAQQHVDEGWKFVRWGLGDPLGHGNRLRAAAGGPRGHPRVRGGAQGARRRPRAVLRPPHPGRSAGGDRVLPRGRGVPPLLRRGSDPRREHVQPAAGPPARNVPIAVGEQFASKWEFREIIEEELTDYARIDLCIAGGLTEAKKIAGWCETHYIKLVTHNPLGPVSSAACAQLNFASPNFGVQEQPTKPYVLLPDVVPVQMEWEDGYIYPPTRPGLGIEFDREAAKQEPVLDVRSAAPPAHGRQLHELVTEVSGFGCWALGERCPEPVALRPTPTQYPPGGGMRPFPVPQNPKPDTQNPTWTDRYLVLLGVEREAPSLDALTRLVRAQVLTVPFENITALLRRRDARPAGAADGPRRVAGHLGAKRPAAASASTGRDVRAPAHVTRLRRLGHAGPRSACRTATRRSTSPWTQAVPRRSRDRRPDLPADPARRPPVGDPPPRRRLPLPFGDEPRQLLREALIGSAWKRQLPVQAVARQRRGLRPGLPEPPTS